MNPRSRTLISIAAATGLVLGLLGCSSSPSAEGNWGSQDEGEPHLVLSSDGTLSGSDGCNRLVGSWEEADGTISFGDGVASTMMFCEGVDTWLSGVHTATVDGDTLRILGADGAEIGTLAKN